MLRGKSKPTHGRALLNLDGTITYTPDENFFGSDSFLYIATDGYGGNETATVSITVYPVNDPPVLDPIAS